MADTTSFDKIAIIGASGFSREVRDICWELGAQNICFLGLESDPSEIEGCPVLLDSDDIVSGLVSDGWRLSIGVGQPRLREAIAKSHSQWPFVNLVHPSATFGKGQREVVENAVGVIVAAGVRLTSNISVGRHVVLNLNATVGHDVILGDFSAVMPNVSISGNVTLEHGVYVGVGAATINGNPDRPLIIGKGATIGAGAVVVRDVEPGATIVGVPGRPLVR